MALFQSGQHIQYRAVCYSSSTVWAPWPNLCRGGKWR